MTNIFRSMFAMLAVLILSVVTFAQSPIADTVSVSVTTSQASSLRVAPETLGGEVNIKKQLGDSGFMLDNTTNVSTDLSDASDDLQFSNIALLRFYPNSHVFVGGGFHVARLSAFGDSSVTLNPALTAGLNLNLGKVTLEPYGLYLSNDVNNRSRSRSLGGGLQIYVPVSDKAGFKLQGSGAKNSVELNSSARVYANNFAAGAGIFFKF